jgi:uncharacterized protein YndB with AHSA1/START domain
MSIIKHLLHINTSTEKVYQALTTLDGLSSWWTTETHGDTNLNGTIQFRFGDMGPDMKVVALEPNQSVVWECVAGADDWIGHQFRFDLDTNDGKTRVCFQQSEWTETGDFYASCNFSWGRYLESLRQYCQTGKGEAFGSEGYRK